MSGTRIIVSYDIADDAIRRQIEKVCKAFGQRVQKSVFECSLSNEQVKELISRLDIVRTNGDVSPSDSIRLYMLCADCAFSVTVLGYKPDVVTDSGHVVI